MFYFSEEEKAAMRNNGICESDIELAETTIRELRNKENNDTDEQKLFIIPVSWSVYSTIRVEADTLEEAIATARAKLDEIPITPECEYIDDSYHINGDTFEDFENAQDYRDISSLIIHKDGTIER